MTTVAKRPGPVLSAYAWKTNGDLIADVARLGYLRRDLLTLDPTWGKGRWWTRFQPDQLIRHDLYTLDHVDFRQLPEDDESVERVAFDPPYVCPGGRKTSTIQEFHERYGMAEVPKNPEGLAAMNHQGLKEITRVLVPKGIVVVKCADYITSGHYWPGVYLMERQADALGLRMLDRFEHIGHRRAQPLGRTRKARKGEESQGGRVPTRQQHARRNLSTLLVLQKPPRRRRRGMRSGA